MKINHTLGSFFLPAAKVGQTTLEQIDGLVGHLNLVFLGQVQPPPDALLPPHRLHRVMLVHDLLRLGVNPDPS